MFTNISRLFPEHNPIIPITYFSQKIVVAYRTMIQRTYATLLKLVNAHSQSCEFFFKPIDI